MTRPEIIGALVVGLIIFVWFWHSIEKQLSAISQQLREITVRLSRIERSDGE